MLLMLFIIYVYNIIIIHDIINIKKGLKQLSNCIFLHFFLNSTILLNKIIANNKNNKRKFKRKRNKLFIS